MTALVLAARLVLAAVFVVAGVTKLTDREGTRRGIVGFGVPEGASSALALLVPLAELVVACLLFPAKTAAYGAIGALVLLGIFSLAIAWNVAHGRTPDCHCFGQLHSAPASWKTLVRNGVLALVAVTALVGALAEPDASATAWLTDLGGAELLALVVAVVAVVLLAVGAFAFLTLMRSYGQVLLRLDRVEHALAEAGIDVDERETLPEVGLAPGTAAPVFAELGELLAPGLPVLLLFTSPNCVPCKALLPRAAEWQREHADVLTVAFASDGDAEDVRAEAEEFELERVLVDEGRRIYESFQANGTPSAVLVAADGTIGSWVASGNDWIERLVDRTLEVPEQQGLPVGTEVPALELPSLEGETVSLATFQGQDTLLLFWNPGCGFCQSMHEDILAWEASANGVGPRLVVVSSGDAETTRAEGFQSLVVLDDGFTAGSAFGANGTPMAVFIDARGRVASAVVAGADAVLELARNDVHESHTS